MGDTNMGGEGGKDNSNDWRGDLIPGVDGRKYFGFPPNLVTKVRYVDTYVLSSASGAVAVQTMRMNSLNDPDSTGGGHQPMFRDTFATVYENYRVLGSKLTATFTPTADSGATGPFWVGINGTNTTTTYSSTPYVRAEANDSSAMWLGQKAGGVPFQTLSLTYSPEEDLGRGPNDDLIGAIVTGNPSSQYYAQVWAADEAASGTTTVRVKIEIHYTVEFFGLVPQATS